MTTHYEVASARDTAVEAVQPGTKLGADPLAQPALVFRSDEVFLVAGTPAELLAFTDRARVAAASLAGGGAGAHRFIVVVESEHPDADAIVHAHALAMMEELDADGRTRGSVQVATGTGAEVVAWVHDERRLHLSLDDLSDLRGGATINVPYADGVGEAVLMSEEDFTPEDLEQLAAGQDVLISADGGLVRVTADTRPAGRLVVR